MVVPIRKHLLVEGKEDLYAIVQLMAAHIAWGNSKKEWPIVIKAVGSASEILAPALISTEFKSREVEILGIIIDADDVFQARWDQIRARCQQLVVGMPDHLPAEGLIRESSDGKRLGIWVMPDNISRGMLETFMRFLVPNAQEPIWLKAQAAVNDAMNSGAKCRECHRDKANIYTWMAWQDPPGQDVGTAIVQNILDPKAVYAAPFVNWFRQLYRV